MKLLQYRKQKKLTQGELAARIGVTQAYICALETGKKQNPSISVLLKIAEALEIPAEELIQDYL